MNTCVSQCLAQHCCIFCSKFAQLLREEQVHEKSATLGLLHFISQQKNSYRNVEKLIIILQLI